MRQIADADVFSPWSTRETELREVALQPQQMECGGLTVDAVAATGAASKATVYPPWTRTASLVFAAITVSVRHGADLIDTGTLRGYRLAGAQGNACTPRRNSATGICTGYVVLRSIVVGWPTHDRTVQILDDIVVPTLT